MPVTQKHPRSFRQFHYVYPVVSRRSGGVSVGINLGNRCNFSCIYCQVLGSPEENGKANTDEIDLRILEEELRTVVRWVRSGELFEDEWFRKTPLEKRRLNDIAFSGDGEPTLSPYFTDAVRIAAKVREEECDPVTKLVLITNATALHVKHIAQTLNFLMENGGEIWAKLDAGSEEAYKEVSGSTVPFSKILANITEISQKYSPIIQTLFLSNAGTGPSDQEIAAYIDRIQEILRAGGTIAGIQIYTVARNTPDPKIAPPENVRIDAIADQIRRATGVPVSTYYSR